MPDVVARDLDRGRLHKLIVTDTAAAAVAALPPPDWCHAETWSDDEEPEIVGCACGRLDDLDRHWPKGGRRG